MVRGTTRFSVILTLLFVVLVGFSACGSLGGGKGKSAVEQHVYSANAGFRVAFYNLENLFDTVDGPNDDAEFLPTAKSQWITKRYEEKLTHIRTVLAEMGTPIVAGFGEIG